MACLYRKCIAFRVITHMCIVLYQATVIFYVGQEKLAWYNCKVSYFGDKMMFKSFTIPGQLHLGFIVIGVNNLQTDDV